MWVSHACMEKKKLLVIFGDDKKQKENRWEPVRTHNVLGQMNLVKAGKAPLLYQYVDWCLQIITHTCDF